MQTSVMVVEDELLVAKNIKQRLEKLGYQVPVVVTSGEEAITKAGEFRPDVVLMDIRLQGAMDGIEAAEQIRQLYHIPIVYLTAYADSETLRRAKITEPYGYIIKPFEERELQSNIEIAVYKHRIEDELEQQKVNLHTIVDTASEVIVTFDKNYKIILWNKAAEKITGYRSKEVLKKSITDLDIVRNSRELIRYLEDVRNDRKAVLDEIFFQEKNGEKRVIQPIYSFCSKTQDNNSNIILIGKDFTQEYEHLKQFTNGCCYADFSKTCSRLYTLFHVLLKKNRNGMLITRKKPTVTDNSSPNDAVKVVYLAQNIKSDNSTVATLEELVTIIKDFISQEKPTIILLTRVDYLLTRFSFDQFFTTIYTINDLISQHQSILLLHLDSSFFNQKQLALLQYEIQPIENQDLDYIELEDQIMQILRFVHEQNLQNTIISFKKIRSKFSISYATTALKLKTLETEGLILIRRYGRFKAVYISDKGKNLLSKENMIND